MTTTAADCLEAAKSALDNAAKCSPDLATSLVNVAGGYVALADAINRNTPDSPDDEDDEDDEELPDSVPHAVAIAGCASEIARAAVRVLKHAAAIDEAELARSKANHPAGKRLTAAATTDPETDRP